MTPIFIILIELFWIIFNIKRLEFLLPEMPAIKLTTGLGFDPTLCFFKYCAASSSAEPPISPIKMIPLGSEN